MIEVGKILRELRDEKHLLQSEVAAALEVDPETISRLERSALPPRRSSTYRRLIEFYGKTVDEVEAIRLSARVPSELEKTVRKIEREGPSPEYLAELKGRPPAAGPAKIPIFGSTTAGKKSANGNGVATEWAPGELYPNDPTAFGFIVDGDSMCPWINPGDIVIATKSLAFQKDGLPDGTPCVICERLAGGEYCHTVKYIYSKPEGYSLVSHNSAYQPRMLRYDQVVCYPVVVRVFRDYLRNALPPGVRGPAATPRSDIGEEPQAFPDYDRG